MIQTMYISVVLPLRLEWIPCYSVPQEMEGINIGDRVKVLFANRRYTGVVCATGIRPDIAPSKIQPILSVEHDMEKIFPQEIELWKVISEYYLCDIGEVYKAAYPSGKVNLEEARAAAKSKVHQRRERLAEGIRTKISRLEARLEKRTSMLGKARKESTRTSYKKDMEQLTEEISTARASLESMVSRTASASRPQESPQAADTSQNTYGTESAAHVPTVMLSEAQSKAYESICSAFASGKPVLLNGVTGSGKTEIYMKLALEVLGSGKNILYLVPEIALSRQLEDRLYEYFGERLLVFHSGESAASRRNTAETIRNESYIVLGTRSSLFLPHHDLGLIIVDEEHDNSYKQDSPAPRYNGRDTALMLSRIHGCAIILGSATPSLEEMYNCQAGRHILVDINEKYHNAERSDIEIIDTKAERRKNGMAGNFSRKLIEQINRTLERGEQVMILRSRRAWAPVMQCDSCGEIVKCPHCNVSLSYHKDGRMVCHYCGHKESYTGTCRKCGGGLMSLGAGTQKIEEEAASLFPNARIARLDSDTAQNKTYETKVIRDFSRGDIDILIGTQIITKGFDFSNLTLVAVIAADALLGMQDFRADEKAFQLLEQFRGRSGRRGRKGLFMIQTSQPEHPVYQKLLSNEANTMDMDLLQERKEFNFPPYSRIVEITVKDIHEDRAEKTAWKLASGLRGRFDTGGGFLNSPVTGPYAPAVDKIADHYIRTIRISLRKDRNLASGKAAIKDIVRSFEKQQKYEGRITINVDPS